MRLDEGQQQNIPPQSLQNTISSFSKLTAAGVYNVDIDLPEKDGPTQSLYRSDKRWQAWQGVKLTQCEDLRSQAFLNVHSSLWLRFSGR